MTNQNIYKWETNVDGLSCDNPYASHYKVPYYFTDFDESAPDGGNKHGIAFREILLYEGDLVIYYGDTNINVSKNYTDSWCTRWDVNNYSIIIETWLTPTEADALRDNIKPGAVGELYKVLGRPLYYDQTWQSENTLRFYPNKYSRRVQHEGNLEGSIPGNLSNMRSDTIGYVKNLTIGTIEGHDDLVLVKIECQVSGSGSL